MYQHGMVILFAVISLILIYQEKREFNALHAIIVGLTLLQVVHIFLEFVLLLSHWSNLSLSIDSHRQMSHLMQIAGSAMLNLWVIWFDYYIKSSINSIVPK